VPLAIQRLQDRLMNFPDGKMGRGGHAMSLDLRSSTFDVGTVA
jgi:hypothetical protein